MPTVTLPNRRVLVLAALSIACVVAGCGGSARSAAVDPAEARRELAASGVAITEDEFRRRYTGGDVETMALLLAAGVDPDVRGPDGSTALMFATDGATVERLLAAGADPDAADKIGRTPLMNAISLGDREIVEILLEAGASPDQADEAGRTPLLLATSMHFDAMVDLLRAHGASPLPQPRIEPALLERYVGSYRSEGSTIYIALDRGRLLLVEEAGSSLFEAPLLPLDEITFYRDRDPAALPFRFEIAEDGSVAGLRPVAGRNWYERVADDAEGGS